MDEKINELITSHPIRKRRVLFVITQSELGGAQRFVSQLVTGLPKEHFDCIVVAGQDGGNALKTLLPGDIPYIIAKNLRRAPNMIEDIKSLFELRNIYRQYKPDVIFLNSSKAGFNGAWAASALPGRIPNLQVMYRIGGWSFNDPQPAWQRIFSIFLERFSSSWKDIIVVNNQKDLEDAKRLHLQPRKDIKLIHNGIDPYMSVFEPDQARQELSKRLGQSLSPTTQLIGTIANFYPTKGLETLLEAAKLLITNYKLPVNFIIIGDGQLRPKLEKMIQDLDLSKKVFLAGQIKNAAQYLRAFDVFVLPSLKEGFPWAALEAMAAKVPVVASSVGAIPEIIEQGKNGLTVLPGDPAELAQAIQTMLEDESLRRQCVIEAHQTIVHHFSLQKMLDTYEELLS